MNTELRISGTNADVIIRNCHAMLHKQFGRDPLWSLVSSITGHGSGFAIEICKSANLDPYQLCKTKTLTLRRDGV